MVHNDLEKHHAFKPGDLVYFDCHTLHTPPSADIGRLGDLGIYICDSLWERPDNRRVHLVYNLSTRTRSYWPGHALKPLREVIKKNAKS